MTKSLEMLNLFLQKNNSDGNLKIVKMIPDEDISVRIEFVTRKPFISLYEIPSLETFNKNQTPSGWFDFYGGKEYKIAFNENENIGYWFMNGIWFCGNGDEELYYYCSGKKLEEPESSELRD